MEHKIGDFLTISRANIQVATIPHALLGIFLAAATLEDITTIDNLLYVILYFVLITFACNVNCLYDIDVDKHYKVSLYRGVISLGIKNVKMLTVLEEIMAIFLIFFLYISGYMVTAILSLLGLLAGLGYSAHPFRVKAKGFFSPFPTFIGLYMLPLFGGWFMVRDYLTFPFILFVVGYALMNEGFTLVNMCEDYSEDKKEGIRTWAHLFGIKNTLHIAFAFSLGGLLCIFPLADTVFSGSVGEWDMVSLFFVAIFLIALFTSVSDVWKSFRGHDLQYSSKKYARKMPLWFMATRYPLLLSALFAIL